MFIFIYSFIFLVDLSLSLSLFLFLFRLFISFHLHVLQTQVLLFLIRPGVHLPLDLGVRRRRVHQRLDVAAGKGIGQDDGEAPGAGNGVVEVGKELVPLGLFVGAERVAALAGLEDLAVEVVAYLGEEALDGGEAAAEGARVDVQLELGALEPAGLALEDVAGEVDDAVDLEGDFLAVLGDLAAGLDVVGAVAAGVADGGHEDDLLEVGDVDHLHVRRARVHAAGAGGREAVHLVGDDVAVCGCARLVARVVERGISGVVGVAKAEGLVLLGRPGEFVLLPLADAVLEVGRDEGVAGGVVDVDAERERLARQHGLCLVDDLGDLVEDFGGLLLARLLTHLEVVDDAREQALDICQLAAAGGDLEVDLDELDSRGVGLDDLAGEVVERGQAQFVVCALGLDGAGGLDLIVLQAAVFAGKGHDDDLAEVGDDGKEKSCNALYRMESVSMTR